MPTANPNRAFQETGQTGTGVATTLSLPSTLTSSSLGPTAPINVTQPAATPTPSVPLAPITPQLGETSSEAQQSDLAKQIADLNIQMTGKAAAQSAAETAQGLPALQQTVKDLTARATALSDQANQIPLIDQQQATGRGITAGGLAPIDTANLRNNAIEALSVHSLLNAAQGNVTYAQSLADRAVAAQFDPIQAKLDALTKNLELIKNDPQTSIEDKNRASAQLDNVNAQKAQIEQQKADMQAVQKVAVSAAQNINTFTPTTDYPTASQAIQAIQSAKTEAEATAIAEKTGLVAPQKRDTSVVDVGGRKVLVDNQTGATIKDLGSTTSATDSLLTVAEAQALGVPYGTTKSQAAAKGIVPGGAGGQSQYQIEGNNRIVESVDNLLPQVNGSTAGIGGTLTGRIPGTSAYNFRAQLDTLKSNIAFGALTQMREASKTGGALGQISDAEERLLSSTLGALDPGQSPEVLKQQLNKIKDSITRWNQAVASHGDTSSGDQYASFRSQLQPGEILVNRNGQATAVTQSELLPTDTRL